MAHNPNALVITIIDTLKKCTWQENAKFYSEMYKIKPRALLERLAEFEHSKCGENVNIWQNWVEI